MSSGSFDTSFEERVLRTHQEDSLVLLGFIVLLCLTVVTVWGFKHRRLRFVHETSLSVLYGLIAGAIIYFVSRSAISQNDLVVLPTQDNASFVPDVLILPFCKSSSLVSHTTPNCSERDLVFIEYTLSSVSKSQNSTGNQYLEKARFNPEIFFNLLLPPIIFNAGYNMKRKHFFRNFGSMLTYAFAGTAVSWLVVGGLTYGLSRVISVSSFFSAADSFYFGAVISATDPVTVLAIFHDLNVDRDLYALVFGESVLNDAVAIVLAGAVDRYAELAEGTFSFSAVLQAFGNFVGIFVGSFALGTFIGVLTALLTKFTHIKQFQLLETALFCLLSFSTFLFAEGVGMSGIVSLLFCGICQAHYTYNNLSSDSQVRTKQVFDLLNFLSESFVFLYIGGSVFTFSAHMWDARFIAITIAAIIIGRACNIYPLSFLLNCGRRNKITFALQHMLMFAGLRGAMAFALAIRNTDTEARKLMFSSTLLIVIVTIVICGSLTTPLLQLLKIRIDVGQELSPLYQGQAEPGASGAGYTGATGDEHQLIAPGQPEGVDVHSSRQIGKHWLVLKWYNVDRLFVKPLLTNCQPSLMDTMPRNAVAQWFARKCTTTEQLMHGASVSGSNGDCSLVRDVQSAILPADDATSDIPVLEIAERTQLSALH